MLPFKTTSAFDLQARNSRFSSKKPSFVILSLLFFGVVLSVESTGIRGEIKNSTEQAIVGITQAPRIVAREFDGEMYILLTEGFRAKFLGESKNSSSDRLASFGINLESAETRDTIYLAHTDRPRFFYSILNILFSLFFGNYSFFVINLLSLYWLVFMYFKFTQELTMHTIVIGLMLMASTVPIFWLSYMPETFLYALVTTYFIMCYQQYFDKSIGLFGPRATITFIYLAPIIACLTKPMFVLMAPILILIIIKLRGATPFAVYFNMLTFIIFGISWLYSAANNRTPLEILESVNPIANIYAFSSRGLGSREESFNLADGELAVSLIPEIFIRELGSQFSKNQNATLLLFTVIALIFWHFRATKEFFFFSTIMFGALLTQSHGAGLGTDLRFVNYALIVGSFFAGRIWTQRKSISPGGL